MGVTLATLYKLGNEPEATASFIELDRTGAFMSAIFLKMQDGTSLIGAPFDKKVLCYKFNWHLYLRKQRISLFVLH